MEIIIVFILCIAIFMVLSFWKEGMSTFLELERLERKTRVLLMQSAIDELFFEGFPKKEKVIKKQVVKNKNV